MADFRDERGGTASEPLCRTDDGTYVNAGGFECLVKGDALTAVGSNDGDRAGSYPLFPEQTCDPASRLCIGI
ncbi:hypothetical protein CKO11_13660 [Rhodobacter sp. TJ_12]|nr:hypothetical protein [Rhodobacter sp. TJ_12]